MKDLKKIVRAGAGLSVCFAALMLAGCSTPTFVEPPDESGAVHGPIDIFSQGDLVVVSYALPGGMEKKPHEERIKDDGTITPPDIGSVIAAGKTAGQLQDELKEKYDKLFRNLTVTVKAGDRFYHVDGEVRIPGPKPYLGETDVLKAIAAGGGFTEFANKKKIRLIHPNGKTDVINYEKAIEDSGKNLPVYPGDQIYVRRRLF